MTSDPLTDMFRLSSCLTRTQITPQHSAEQLKQHLEADTSDCRVVPSLAQLISDKRMLRMSNLIPRERHTSIMQRLANEISSRRRHMRIFLAKDHDELALDIACALNGIIILTRAE